MRQRSAGDLQGSDEGHPIRVVPADAGGIEHQGGQVDVAFETEIPMLSELLGQFDIRDSA